MTDHGLGAHPLLKSRTHRCEFEASVYQDADALKLHLFCSGMGRYATAGHVWFGCCCFACWGNTGQTNYKHCFSRLLVIIESPTIRQQSYLAQL